MIKKLISFAIEQRLVVAALSVLLIGYGFYAYNWLPVEAFPDVDDPQVQIFTQYPGQSAEDVEAQITRPIEEQLNSTPHLKQMRSTSIFGLSVVTMTFEDDVNIDIARSNVLNAMQQVGLPTGVQWQMGSLTTSVNEVYRYVIYDPYHKIEEIRAVQDWVLEPAFRQIEGVGDFETYGGALKQYQVFVKPELLSQHGVTLQQVFQVLQNNNLNVGGNILKTGQQALVIRGTGLLRTIEDIGNVPITTYNARPVFIKDVADVTTGPGPRQGITAITSRNPPITSDDCIEGVVLNLQGTDALRVIERINAQVDHLNKDVLPQILPGAKIIKTYDRTDLVETTLHTVMHNLLLGGVLILIITILFTSSVRAALVIWLVIPLALLSAFVTLYIKGIPANLLSFGAVDFGILVDAAVVIVEAILVAKLAYGTNGDFDLIVRDTSSGLARSMIFSQLILIVALIPIFTFQHVEGRIFRPMALTFAGAIVGAILVTFTIVPLMSAILLKRGKASGENFVSRWLQKGYGKIINVLLDFPLPTLGVALLVLVSAVIFATRLGTEFLPKLDEGNIWLDVNMPLSISPDAAKDNERRIRHILAEFPESTEIVTQLGRPEDGYDDKGWNHIEVAVFFPSRDQWTTRDPKTGKVVDKEGLITLMNDRLSRDMPGCTFNFSQVIEDNVEEALSGVQGELVIKLFGDDLSVLQEKGQELTRIIVGVPGNADLECEKLQGQPDLTVEVDRTAVARYGTDAQTVLSLVQTGLGGQSAGNILEGQRTFPLSVRLAAPARQEVSRIGDVWVDTATGQRIPLKSLANIRLETGSSRIMRDYNRRRIAVKCSVRGRDMGSFVTDAQARVDRLLKPTLPPGYEITWEGQFENQRRANARLMVIVPLSILGIVVLLYWAFARLRYALIILSDVPFAIVGGIVILYFTHTSLSVSATIGFIALAAVSVQNGMILIGQFNHFRAKGMPLKEAVAAGAEARVRPVTMTALIALLGMLPMALSRGVGSEVQRPLALVIVGGMVSAMILTLLVLPVLYETIERWFPAEVTVPEGMVH